MLITGGTSGVVRTKIVSQPPVPVLRAKEQKLISSVLTIFLIDDKQRLRNQSKL